MSNATTTKRPTAREQAQSEARERLLEWLKPGDTVYCILRHVSASGMTRVIDLVTMPKGEDNVSRHIAYNAAELMGMTYDRKREGIRIGGCGMDMGFALVYDLGRYLWPDGFECIGEGDRSRRCMSSDHSNGDRDYTPHMHSDGGYALNFRWL